MKAVVILDCRAAGVLRENRQLLEGLSAAGKVRPRGWRTGTYRSLAILADGSCELQKASAGAVARRLGEVRTGRRRGK